VSGSHPSNVRDQALQLLFQGRSVRDVAVQLGLPQQTVYRWHRTCISQSELMQARARIEVLEGEVAACRHLIDLMKEVVPPKDGTR
jgi:hypothetical protein